MRDVHIHRTAVVRSDHIDSFTRVGALTCIDHTAEISLHCRIGSYCHIENGVRIGRQVTIQDGVLIPSGVTIADQAVIGSHVTFAAALGAERGEVKPTLVQQGARIGAAATIHGGVTIGRYAQIDPGAVVAQDVPDFAHLSAGPARQQGWVCCCGQRLDLGERGGGQATCSCGRKYVLSEGCVSGVAPLPV